MKWRIEAGTISVMAGRRDCAPPSARKRASIDSTFPQLCSKPIRLRCATRPVRGGELRFRQSRRRAESMRVDRNASSRPAESAYRRSSQMLAAVSRLGADGPGVRNACLGERRDAFSCRVRKWRSLPQRHCVSMQHRHLSRRVCRSSDIAPDEMKDDAEFVARCTVQDLSRCVRASASCCVRGVGSQSRCPLAHVPCGSFSRLSPPRVFAGCDSCRTARSSRTRRGTSRR